MKTIFLIGLLIAAAYAASVEKRFARIEKNMTHLWNVVHDMEKHLGTIEGREGEEYKRKNDSEHSEMDHDDHGHHGDMLEAHCDLMSNNADQSFKGHIHLKQINKDLLSVNVDFDCPSGVAPGTKLDLHVHEGSNMSHRCDSLGGRYNPHGVEHGPMTGTPDTRHVGDWGNVVCDNENEVEHEFKDRVAQLKGPNSIMNRSIVLRKDTGAAGGRLACCIIRKKMN